MHPASHRSNAALVRARSAAAQVREAGGTALEGAFAAIGAGTITPHEMLKDRVAHVLRTGAGHPSVVWRYRKALDAVPHVGLDLTLAWLRDDLVEARRQRVEAPRCARPLRINAVIPAELCLILRFMRRYAPQAFEAARDAVLGIPTQLQLEVA